MRKKLFVTFLIVAVVFSAAFARGTEEAPSVETQVILGSTTQVNADFFDGWTNSATNAYLKGMMGGYETVSWTREGRFVVNPVAITSFDAKDNADGKKTYTCLL